MSNFKSGIRWVLALLLGVSALGSLSVGIVPCIVMLAGCAVISPVGGAWLGSKLMRFENGTSQVVLGIIVVFIGAFLGLDQKPKADEPELNVPASVLPVPVAVAVGAPTVPATSATSATPAASTVESQPGEVRDFTGADFFWDRDTKKAKTAIMKAVNRIHREDPRCKDSIDPASMSKADIESKQQKKPVYFVACGEGANAVNVYFDASRADDPTPFREPGHIQQSRAIDLCEAYAKASATHPSTVDFSRFMDIVVSEHPNGRTMITSTFTAKNAFNLELKYNIRCLLDENGFIEGHISEE